MVSIPTALFPVIGFLVLAAFLVGTLESSDTSSVLYNYKAMQDKSIENIKGFTTTEPTGYLDAIYQVGKTLLNVIILIFSYLQMPFILLVSLLVEVLMLPPDLAPIVSVFLTVGVLAGIAIFIRRG